MSWSVNDGHTILVGLKFPQGNTSGDALTVSFEFIQDPGILEGALPHLNSLHLEFLDGRFVGPSTLVDQMASGGRLAGICVAGGKNVDMSRFLSHSDFDLVVVFMTPVFWWQSRCEKAAGFFDSFAEKV